MLIRRTHKQLVGPRGILDETRKVYPKVGGRYSQTAAEWRFRSGAVVFLRALQHTKDLENYQGMSAEWWGIDEATHFSQDEIAYFWGRARSVTGIQPRLRMTCNPSNDSWIFRFLFWWLDPLTGYPIKERSGVVRHFLMDGDEFVWFDEPQYDDAGECTTTSASFIPATIDDNKALMAADPLYRQRLMNLPPHERDKYLSGCWLASSSKDTVWGSEYFIDTYIEDDDYPVPENFAKPNSVVRMFSLDPSMGKHEKKGDMSAIVCLAQTSDLKYIDCDASRRPPGQLVQDLFLFCNSDLHRIYGNDLIGVEGTANQALFGELIRAFAKENPDYALSSYLNSGNQLIDIIDNTDKSLRIRRLDHPIRNRQCRFLRNPGTAILLQQLRGFTGVQSARILDDCADAMAMANNLPLYRKEMFERQRNKK